MNPSCAVRKQEGGRVPGISESQVTNTRTREGTRQTDGKRLGWREDEV